jgi:hypothetical protein
VNFLKSINYDLSEIGEWLIWHLHELFIHVIINSIRYNN